MPLPALGCAGAGTAQRSPMDASPTNNTCLHGRWRLPSIYTPPVPSAPTAPAPSAPPARPLQAAKAAATGEAAAGPSAQNGVAAGAKEGPGSKDDDGEEEGGVLDWASEKLESWVKWVTGETGSAAGEPQAEPTNSVPGTTAASGTPGPPATAATKSQSPAQSPPPSQAISLATAVGAPAAPGGSTQQVGQPQPPAVHEEAAMEDGSGASWLPMPSLLQPLHAMIRGRLPITSARRRAGEAGNGGASTLPAPNNAGSTGVATSSAAGAAKPQVQKQNGGRGAGVGGAGSNAAGAPACECGGALDGAAGAYEAASYAAYWHHFMRGDEVGAGSCGSRGCQVYKCTCHNSTRCRRCVCQCVRTLLAGMHVLARL